MERIYLSPPNVSKSEKESVASVLDSGWIAPVGPAIDEFEVALEAYFEGKSVAVLNSGTSALHLALILAGIEQGDEVLVGSFTFAACANVILYERAVPIFLDSEDQTWNLDPEILRDYLKGRSTIPKALIAIHLYGMPAKIQEIKSICEEYGICLIEDAAEALGSTIAGRPVGSFGHYGIISFNGNKIITTSAGGALVCNESDKQRAIHLATQANSGKLSYNHLEAGYNYRMSNVLAGLGVAQLKRLDEFAAKKRAVFERYREELNDFFTFTEELQDMHSNRWLTVVILRNEGHDPQKLVKFLDEKNIESRLLWKPLHLHEAYASAEFVGTGICEKIFESGICLPSGTGLTDKQQQMVISSIKEWFGNQ